MRNIFAFFIAIICTYNSLSASGDQDKLFSLLSPKQTHIQFNNKITDTKTHNILIYSNYYGGAGVGVGDLNNDGLQDIYFAGNQVGDQLYLNKGNMVFEDITAKAGITDNGGWSSGVIFGDVNQDGLMDIYVTRELYDEFPELRKNVLYINQGIKNGVPVFSDQAEAFGVADTQRTRNACFLDYDRDGDLDLFLCNQPPNPGDYSPFYNTELLLEKYTVRLLENVGGKFEDVTQKAGLFRTGFPNSATASDLNGDGWVDLYIANDFWVGDWLYLNNGDGTFTDYIDENVKHISFSSMGVDAADINNDGLLDVMVLDMAAEDNYRSKANMSGMNPAAFWKVVDEGGHYQYMFNTLQLNRGNAVFSEIAQLAGISNTDWSWSNLIADLDNDGWKDIFVTNGLMRDIRNKDASKVFKEYVESSLHKYVSEHPDLQGKTLWDVVDLDHTLNLVPSEKLSNYVYKNRGDLTFSKEMESWGLDQKTFSNGAAYADLDNDGDLDIIVSNVNDKASIYENHAAGQANQNYLRIQPVSNQKEVSVFNTQIWIETAAGQQFFEITGARGMYSTSEMFAHFGLGKEKTVKNIRIRWADGKETNMTDVPANQVLTVKYGEKATDLSIHSPKPKPLLTNATGKMGPDYKHEENKFDDFRIQVLLPHKMSGFGPALAKGDFNGDGLEDVFAGGSAGKPAAMFIQNADGSFESWSQDFLMADKIHEDLGAVFFDSDQDGDLDLFVVSGGNEFLKDSDRYQDRLYINDGKGQFTKGEGLLPELHISGSKVYPEDIDQDGDLDLFVAGRQTSWSYPEPTSSALLLNDGGKFTNATEALAPSLINIGMINDASWFDYDGDGWKDLVLVGEWTAVTILPNEKGRLGTPLPSSLSEETGWWFSVETADIDRDGDMDIIAGNLGLNYKYKASDEEPFGVYYYDFDENGSKDIVLTYYNFGIQYPLRGRQCSSEQIPDLKKKFKTYDTFASSDVFQIYGENELETALHFDAYTFASYYIENQGNGRFKMHQLPVETQFSSVNDIIVDDFNGDQHLDLVLAGNLYDAEVETTRNDAGIGLMLLGDGKGHFKSLSYEESGVFLPYDVKNMLTVESQGQQLILVGCNNEQLQVLSYGGGK